METGNQDAWKTRVVRQMNGKKERITRGQIQIASESWNRVAAVPYIVYMPEKKRLLMLMSCDYPHRPMVSHSDDFGASWTLPRPVCDSDNTDTTHHIGVSLTYLSKGNVLMAVEGKSARWFSSNYGQTWVALSSAEPTPEGMPWYQWDQYLVDRDRMTGNVTRIAETGYSYDASAPLSQGYIRFSEDEGRTWSQAVKVPQWRGVNEVALGRATNGNMIAACRMDEPEKYRSKGLDHYCSFGMSVSKDNGKTWSELNVLYELGRMHPSLVTMPNGDVVMTYVVRRGYTDDKDGFIRFGIEAIVSRDNGLSWDLDHKYILAMWSSNRKGPNDWWGSCQSTSSVLLPDGSILTAFGTGYRSQPVPAENIPGKPMLPSPRDIGLVKWRLNSNRGLVHDTTITDAPVDSELRNIFDPTPRK